MIILPNLVKIISPTVSGLPTTLIAELKRGLTIIGIGHLTAIITCIRRGKCIIYTQGVQLYIVQHLNPNPNAYLV